jgi:hypothetical protein
MRGSSDGLVERRSRSLPSKGLLLRSFGKLTVKDCPNAGSRVGSKTDETMSRSKALSGLIALEITIFRFSAQSWHFDSCNSKTTLKVVVKVFSSGAPAGPPAVPSGIRKWMDGKDRNGLGFRSDRVGHFVSGEVSSS